MKRNEHANNNTFRDESVKRIKLTRGYYAIIDDEDYERVNQFKWHINIYKNCYRAIKNVSKFSDGNKSVFMHRFIMNEPQNLEIDHIDGNSLNNQKSNLRVCNRIQNNHNTGIRINNHTGYKGVHYNGKYIRARLKLNTKLFHLGYFPDLISAAKAYDKKAKELHGEFARLNFPEETK